MTIPIFNEFMYPILEILSDGKIYTNKEIYDKIIKKLNFTKEDLLETTKGGTTTKIKDRISWSLTYMNHSPLITKVSWGKYKIGDEGINVVNDKKINRIDEKFLIQYPQFRRFHRGNDNNSDEINYWLYSPGHSASKWKKYYKNGVMGIGFSDVGDLSQYKTKNDLREKVLEVNDDNTKHTNEIHAFWQFANEIKKGDIVYAKKGMSKIIGYGVVEGEYYYDTEFDEHHKHMIKVNWKEKCHGEYDGKLPQKTLTNITNYEGMLKKIQEFFEGDTDPGGELIDYPLYTEEDFFDEVFMDINEYNTLVNLIKFNKNIIIEGAPGVGKTYISEKLAYSIMGVKDKEKVELVQFHQSYSYEDFIMGYRPSRDGFVLEEGVFYDFCKKAEEDDENEYFFIIDEINRGNLSKIFGELFMLIEGDKRGKSVRLLYNKELFSIPENVYIIGLMNTADRSLAMLDYALRRRFTFYDLIPAFNNLDFKKYVNSLNSSKFIEVIHVINELNNEISDDEVLGEGFQIGHSYFTGFNEDTVDEELEYVIEYNIIPLIKEYWFDETSKVDKWSSELRSVML